VYQLYLEEQRRQKAVELEKELEEKRHLANKNNSHLQQLRERRESKT